MRSQATCTITRTNGSRTTVPLVIRLDTAEDIAYWRNGGILPFVWRDFMQRGAPVPQSA